MSNLYELTQEYLSLLELAEDPEIDPEVFQDTLEGMEGEIEYKADGYAKVIKELEAEADKFKKEAERCAEKHRTISNNIKRMKESLKNAMLATGRTNFKTDLFRFSVAKNGGKQPIEYVDGKEIPEEYRFYEWKPDTVSIKQALDAGKELGFARYGDRGTHVSIR